MHPDNSSLRFFHIAMETDVMSVLVCGGLSDYKLVPLLQSPSPHRLLKCTLPTWTTWCKNPMG